MGNADDYRKNAGDCYQRARDASSLAFQTEWLGMAQFWLRLAQQAEEQDLIECVDATDSSEDGREDGDKQSCGTAVCLPVAW